MSQSQQMDIFTMFMSQEERDAMKRAEEKKKEEEKKAAEEKKKTASKKKSSSKTSGSSVAEEIEIGAEGITVITGYYPEKTLLPADFEKEIEEGEKVKLSASEVIRFAIKAGLESFIEGHTKLAKLKSGKYLMAMSSGAGTLTDKSKMCGEYRILLGGYETTVSENDGEDDRPFGLKEVQKVWYNSYPDFENISDFISDDDRKVIVPVFKQKPVKDAKEGLVYIFGNIPCTVSNESLEAVAKREFAEYEGNYHIVQYGEGEYFLVPHIKAGMAAKKEMVYPTKDVSLSFVFSRIPLTPEMFDGKEEVTEKELLAYITEDFPEYGNGRSSIEYLKKEKLILVSIKSAKKGAGLGLATTFEADLENVEEKLLEAKNFLKSDMREYAICFLKLRDPSFPMRIRLEKNSIGTFIGCDRSYSNFFDFHMTLPKIPRYIMEEIYCFFLAVKNTMSRSNEAAAQIFWDKSQKKYFVYYPQQVVDTISVNFERSMELEHDSNNVLVMDVHSHGVIRPTFSVVDDNDEKGTRLYCVIGNMNDTTAYHFSLRAGTGGNFIPVADEDVFEDFYNGMSISKKVLKSSRKDAVRLRELIADKVVFK